MKKESTSSTNKEAEEQSFLKILHIIARDFKLHEYSENNYKRELLIKPEFKEQKKCKIN